MKTLQQCLKRSIDFIGAAFGLFILFPVMMLVALAIRIHMGAPVLFRQPRAGRGGRPFVLFKFRSMLDARDAHGNPLPDEKRLTWLGQLLRRTSLDELPQLFNVLVGDMSLVGPRPLLVEFVDHYTPEQGRRHDVGPGITGWAQVHGRSSAPYSQRLKMDVWYVDNWNLWLDVKILWKTLLKVVKSEGTELPVLENVDDIGLHPETRRKAAEAASPPLLCVPAARDSGTRVFSAGA